MLHITYLRGLCQRRQWSEPHYEVTASRRGYTCVVRVNNREYQTAKAFPSEVTAQESAACIAFNICRNFSVNDGQYPAGFTHDNVVQGRAVPVGTGRVLRRPEVASTISPDYRSRQGSMSSDSRSGGSSPDLFDDTNPYLYRQQYQTYSTERQVDTLYTRRRPEGRR